MPCAIPVCSILCSMSHTNTATSRKNFWAIFFFKLSSARAILAPIASTFALWWIGYFVSSPCLTYAVQCTFWFHFWLNFLPLLQRLFMPSVWIFSITTAFRSRNVSRNSNRCSHFFVDFLLESQGIQLTSPVNKGFLLRWNSFDSIV